MAQWIDKQGGGDSLVVTTAVGKQSDALKRMSDSKERIDTIHVQSITGENSWVVITFKHARIRGYSADPSGKAEHWKAVDFDAADIKRLSIGSPRP